MSRRREPEDVIVHHRGTRVVRMQPTGTAVAVVFRAPAYARGAKAKARRQKRTAR